MIKKIFPLIAVLSLSTVLALPTVTLDATQVSPGIYSKEVPSGADTTITMKITNPDNVVYRFNIVYSGQLSVLILGPTGGTIGSGTAFTTPYLTINPGTTLYLYLKYKPTSTGTFVNTYTIKFEQKVATNNTTSWTPVTTKVITLQLKVTGTQPQQQQPTTQQKQPEECLVPLRTKIYKIVYLNETLTISVGFINQCNTTIELLDADIEGVPSDIAYISQTELKHKLEPGDVQYIKVTVDTTHLVKPQELLFDVILIGKKELSVETARTSIDVKVITKESRIPSKKEEQETYPSAKLLHVDYEIKNNYLVIKAVYYIQNNTKIYLTDVPIYILTDEGQTVYYRPIPVEPGKTYCISINLKGFVPYFECVQAPKKDLCYQLTPAPKKIGNVLYYKEGTTVKVTVFDCNTGEPIDANIFLDNIKLNNNTFTVTAGAHTLKIKDGKEYKEITIGFTGYKPLSIEITPYPDKPGNYTITLKGTFVANAEVTIYYGNKVIYRKIGPVHKVSLDKEGTYRIVVKTSIEEATKTIYLSSASEKQYGTSIWDTIWNIGKWILIVIGAFIILTIIVIFVVKRRSSGGGLLDAAKQIGELAKQA